MFSRDGLRERESTLRGAWQFARGRAGTIAGISALVLAPCFWHRRIEAGDLGSHVYNAWLAQLIEKGQAPGLYIAHQWNNIVFDLMLLKLGHWFGLAAAEKISVSVCVLIFFWGAFALIAAVTRRVPWFLTPCMAMLAYGWTFNMGFFNYYLSLGIGFFAIAIFWRGRGRELILGLALAPLVLVAHPQGFVWLAGCVGYVMLWRWLPASWKLILPAAALLIILVLHFYLQQRYESYSVWDSFGAGIYGGSDQLALYGMRSYILSGVALLLGITCFAADVFRRWIKREAWVPLRLPVELYIILIMSTYLLPDVLRVPFYSGWIGALAIRLTTISAVMGMCVVAFVQPRKWHAIGFGAIAAGFFTFLYQDTGSLNRMEEQVETLVSSLPRGERVAATIWAPPESRLPHIVHMVDRACIGKCFSFQNYEPAAGEFRVRVREENSIVTDDPDASQAMEAGEYMVQPKDLPMAQLYQCNERDLTQVCVRELVAGEVNGRLGYRPPKE